MLKLFSCFAGYGTDHFALKQLGIEFECVGFSEIDKYAIQCFQQNHQGKNYGDISQINWQEVPDFDLITGGFPCQDVSSAGKMDLSKGRTILGMELTKALHIRQPKYFLFENVKGLMSQRFEQFRTELIKSWEDCGYKIYYKVLNSKDYGIPQSRPRVFFVGIRKDIEQTFDFPEIEELKIFIKDILEPEVDEKYYLSPLLQERFSKYLIDKENKLLLSPYNFKHKAGGTQQTYTQDVCSVQLANKNRGKIPYNPEDRQMTFDINKEPISYTIKQAQHEFLVYDKKDLSSFRTRNLTKDVSPALQSAMSHGNTIPLVIANCIKVGGIPTKPEHFYEKKPHNITGESGRLRRLTPKECFRLMGFLNDEINLEGLSDTQKYRLAGNGQSVNVVRKIFQNLLREKQ
jgi:DNA (cytosine-5)-methyltransferase 1